MTGPAYVAALRMLARRELSEAQVRQRLARRGHTPESIDEAVARLTTDRSLDDSRAARAIARTEALVRGRGHLRVRRQIEAAGIAPAIAQRAVDEVYQELDPDHLLTAALARRLRGRDTLDNARDMQRLYRYLTAQGFEPDRVLALLRARAGPRRLG